MKYVFRQGLIVFKCYACDETMRVSLSRSKQTFVSKAGSNKFVSEFEQSHCRLNDFLTHVYSGYQRKKV